MIHDSCSGNHRASSKASGNSPSRAAKSSIIAVSTCAWPVLLVEAFQKNCQIRRSCWIHGHHHPPLPPPLSPYLHRPRAPTTRRASIHRMIHSFIHSFIHFGPSSKTAPSLHQANILSPSYISFVLNSANRRCSRFLRPLVRAVRCSLLSVCIIITITSSSHHSIA